MSDLSAIANQMEAWGGKKDADVLRKIEASIAELERQLEDCKPYLKENETPAECIKRNRDEWLEVFRGWPS